MKTPTASTLPKVGQAATYQIGSDFYPCTVTRVSATGAKLVVTLDRVRGGTLFLAGDEEVVAYRNAAGRYRVRGGYITVGERVYRLDPSF